MTQKTIAAYSDEYKRIESVIDRADKFEDLGLIRQSYPNRVIE